MLDDGVQPMEDQFWDFSRKYACTPLVEVNQMGSSLVVPYPQLRLTAAFLSWP